MGRYNHPNTHSLVIIGNGQNSSVDGDSQNASFKKPMGIAINESDELFVTTFYGFKIRKIDPNGYVTTFSGSGTEPVIGETS